jgi:hypothetical protein
MKEKKEKGNTLNDNATKYFIMTEKEEKEIGEKLRFANCRFQDGEIEEDKLVSLKEFASSVQHAYLKFKEEYDAMDKIDLGRIDFVSFYAKEFNGLKHRGLKLRIREKGTALDEKLPKGETCWVSFTQSNPYDLEGIRFLSYTLDKKGDIDNVYKEYKNYDPRKLLEYLDLFERHNAIFGLNSVLSRNSCICSKGGDTLQVHFYDVDGNIMNGVSNVEFVIDSYHAFSKNYNVHLLFNLENDLVIDYKKSYIEIGDKKYHASNEMYELIANYIKFNRTFLDDYDLDFGDMAKGRTRR